MAPTAYSAECELCQSTHSLPRSHTAIRESIRLQRQLDAAGIDHPRTRFGVLIGVDSDGRTGVLWAHSGDTAPPAISAAWVPPAELTDAELTKEYDTLTSLRGIEQELQNARKQVASIDARVSALHNQHNTKLQAAQASVKAGNRDRQLIRQAGDLSPEADDALRAQSRSANSELRRVKRALKTALAPLQAERADIEGFRASLKRQRRLLMQDLSSHAKTSASTEAEGSASGHGATPTCCAPKLLQYAIRYSIRPIGLAEFERHEPSSGRRQQSWRFVGPCQPHCVPLLPALLCWMGEERVSSYPT